MKAPYAVRRRRDPGRGAALRETCGMVDSQAAGEVGSRFRGLGAWPCLAGRGSVRFRGINDMYSVIQRLVCLDGAGC